ncbi:holo-ACP synthase [Borrelia sp. BU AG58]|uniref:holo-ACP synthase n=1 Tax=Borrelia sp. BU AG58 TaxID=2887345 RepID=UPI001E4ACF20|nr:holo-ACP synthase [Borrelia sp. BU AG58]UER67982.1 holo-ACP synthase [Borrelia sp. BU AG58]
MKSIGCDIIQVSRLNGLLENRKKLERFFTQREIGNLEMKGKGVLESLAGKFAAKEALIKSLGPLLENKIKYSLKDMEVVKLPAGNVVFRLHNDVEDLINKMNLRVYLTISHEREYAVAFVMIED